MFVDASAVVATWPGARLAAIVVANRGCTTDRRVAAGRLRIRAGYRENSRDLGATGDGGRGRFPEERRRRDHPHRHRHRHPRLDAFARFGKGRHPAALNMGDCFAYACAKARAQPLLCKGDDFGRTDALLA